MPYPYERANAYDSGTGKDNVEQKNTPFYSAAVTLVQLKTGPGYVDVVSGLPGTGAVNIYDAVGTLNTQIGSFPAGSTAVAATGVIPIQTLNLHAAFNNGLYVNIVSTATVFNGTISYS